MENKHWSKTDLSLLSSNLDTIDCGKMFVCRRYNKISDPWLSVYWFCQYESKRCRGRLNKWTMSYRTHSICCDPALEDLIETSNSIGRVMKSIIFGPVKNWSWKEGNLEDFDLKILKFPLKTQLSFHRISFNLTFL